MFPPRTPPSHSTKMETKEINGKRNDGFKQRKYGSRKLGGGERAKRGDCVLPILSRHNAGFKFLHAELINSLSFLRLVTY